MIDSHHLTEVNVVKKVFSLLILYRKYKATWIPSFKILDFVPIYFHLPNMSKGPFYGVQHP